MTITGSQSINPRSIKPLGNLIISPFPTSNYNPKKSSLGDLSILPDEILLLVFSELDLSDLFRSQAVNKHFFAWCAGLDGLWKAGFISRNHQRLSDWKGSWRSSYILKFIVLPSRNQTSNLQNQNHLPTDLIRTPNVFSDVLFQPILCVNHSIQSILNPLNRSSSSKLNLNIEKQTVVDPKAFKIPKRPAILKGLIDKWPAYDPSSLRRWTLDSLIQRYPRVEFRAESTLATLADYRQYHDACLLDESPVYLFDSEFVEKTAKNELERGLGADYSVPEMFQQDLFSCLGNNRPDYRWLIIGPARSGSTWHIDPNGTSAWNAVITGRKYWICFPPHVVPPGVLVNEDESEVESPLSISEWFLNYYRIANETYGRFSKNPETRGLMLEGICEAGETFFVPSGWWHLVINLEPSIAITQNFVSENELSSVLHFMKYKPDQLSGFKFNEEDTADETENRQLGSECIFEKFVEQLTLSNKIKCLTEHLNTVEQLEVQRKLDNSRRTHHHGVNWRESDTPHQIIKKRKDQSDLSSAPSSIWNQIKKKRDDLRDADLKDSNVDCGMGERYHASDGQAIDSNNSSGFKFQFDIEE